MNQKWTRKEEALLRKLYPETGTREIAQTMNRTPHAIKTRAVRLGVKKRNTPKPWRAADVKRLRKLYPHLPTAEVARRMNRSITSIYGAVDRFNTPRKTEEYLASPAACRLRRGDNPGIPFRFKPGHVPWTKGLKGIRLSPKTEFKKGSRSGEALRHWMPIGATRIIKGTKDRGKGYLYRKVSDIQNVPYTVNWKPEHHLLWIKHHGKIPKGYAIVFKDGNRENIVIGNLEAIKRADLLRRNSLYNFPQPLIDVIKAQGYLNRRLRRMENAAKKQAV